jgi:hypothetical protein
MKLYEKIIDGKQQCKPANEIVIIKDGMQTFNPTEEMLLEDGWKVHESIPYEPTKEEILNREKKYKIEEIIRYDSSPEVNIFYIGGHNMWLDKATRVGLKLRFDAEIARGYIHTTLWYEGIPFNLELFNAVQMLNELEVYASECYDNTQMHMNTVNKLETIEEVESYDFRVGYPKKLNF